MALCFSCTTAVLAQQAKYVFFFIGDGMGLNQVNTTEFYQASVKGNLGTEPLFFASFPYTTFATSNAFNTDVTDSAAAGTALATAQKTRKGMLGMSPDSVAVSSIAEWARNSGKKVGICTTVSIDHATPAAYYAHQINRNMYNAIGHDLAESGFDYFGGADFLQPVGKDSIDLHQYCEEKGYTWAYGYQEAKNKWKDAKKLIMVQTKEATKEHHVELPYVIDREPNDLSLPQIVETGINMLTKDNKKGFFFMIEGGEIDHACHANDAATAIKEIQEMDEAVKLAYEFYKKHPKETLIIVTADHETGGLVPGNGSYALNLQALQYQTCSVERVTKRFENLRRSRKRIVWEDAKEILSECYGLFTHVPVNWEEEAELRTAFEDTFLKGAVEENWYGTNSVLATKGRDILNKKAMVSWASLEHSDGYIPIFAVGVGADQFHGRLDNTDLPKMVAKIAGYKK